VLAAVYELFIDLGADDAQIDFPVAYTDARAGRAALAPADVADAPDLKVLMDLLVDTVPAPQYEEGHPFQALVTNLDASPYVGRLALCRVYNGGLRKGQTVAWCRGGANETDVSEADSSGEAPGAPAVPAVPAAQAPEAVRISELYVTDALERVDAPEDGVGPGDIIAVAGIPSIMIGDTLADLNDPRPLPPIAVDEPSLAMTIGVNTSPLAGAGRAKGSAAPKLTARVIKNRLDAELVGNVSIRVLPTDRPDVWEVLGRGELALAVLVETMRREGFELTVGKPRVLTREVDGARQEPVERVSVDVPEDYVGVATQLLSVRKGRMESMVNHGATTGWCRMEWVVPARGLIGFRTEFLTETRGTGQLHHVFEGWEPWHGELRTRPNGSMVADRRGTTTSYALLNLQARGSLFVGPGVEVYEGMIVGENARAEDMDVNPTKERKLTNMRSSTAEELVRLVPPQVLSLEAALEFIRVDECVEVTSERIRLRKLVMPAAERARRRARDRS
jgi:GTP-binding protein